jgi:hypothetical protein
MIEKVKHNILYEDDFPKEMFLEITFVGYELLFEFFIQWGLNKS